MINPLYVRAGIEVITLLTRALALYQRGDMTDQEFREGFIDPMRARVRSASDRWRNNNAVASNVEHLLDREIDRLDQAIAAAQVPPLTPRTPDTPDIPETPEPSDPPSDPPPQNSSGVPGDGEPHG